MPAITGLKEDILFSGIFQSRIVDKNFGDCVNNALNIVKVYLSKIYIDKASNMMKYQVYVVELSKKVFTENTKFRFANPQFNGVLQCVYVGMTSKTPAERLKQHKTGYVNRKGYKLSANIVEKYGTYLCPSLYDHINVKPMTRQEAD